MEDPKITPERVEALLGRGPAMGLALEKWQRAGLWVLESSDEEYPLRLNQRLGDAAPPVIFGAGSRGILQVDGVAIVGSRAASPDHLEAASEIGAGVARQGFAVISGAARGIDQAAMTGALERGGTVIGIPSFGLLSDATGQNYRRGLMDMDLALVSPFNPESRFDVGKAMGRNKLIYAMSMAAIVVVTDAERGGTWAGATECLRKKWVPVWVRGNEGTTGGNAALVSKGARWLPDDFVVRELAVSPSPPSLLGEERGSYAAEGLETYEQFVAKLRLLVADGPAAKNEVKAAMGLSDKALNSWLVRALAEGVVDKLTKPVRYQATRAKLL
jgi:predicted Rossmann fold nucleotide-binding protein DprA/Smf involved in DNA uptake